MKTFLRGLFCRGVAWGGGELGANITCVKYFVPPQKHAYVFIKYAYLTVFYT